MVHIPQPPFKPPSICLFQRVILEFGSLPQGPRSHRWYLAGQHRQHRIQYYTPHTNVSLLCHSACIQSHAAPAAPRDARVKHWEQLWEMRQILRLQVLLPANE